MTGIWDIRQIEKINRILTKPIISSTQGLKITLSQNISDKTIKVLYSLDQINYTEINYLIISNNTIEIELDEDSYIKIAFEYNGVIGEYSEPVLIKTFPSIDGISARFDSSSFDENAQVWNDLSGNNRNMTTSAVSLITNTPGTNGANEEFVALYGGTNAQVQWNYSGSSSYSLVHVSRYAGGTKGRIWMGQNNWLSGFWSGRTGLACCGFVPNSNGYSHGNNWIIITHLNNRFRSKSKNVNNGNFYNATGSIGNWGSYMGIRYGAYSNEVSQWATAEIIIFNGKTLNSNEYELLENYLENKYGI